MVARIKDLTSDPTEHVHKDVYADRVIKILLIILKF